MRVLVAIFVLALVALLWTLLAIVADVRRSRRRSRRLREEGAYVDGSGSLGLSGAAFLAPDLSFQDTRLDRLTLDPEADAAPQTSPFVLDFRAANERLHPAAPDAASASSLPLDLLSPVPESAAPTATAAPLEALTAAEAPTPTPEIATTNRILSGGNPEETEWETLLLSDLSGGDPSLIARARMSQDWEETAMPEFVRPSPDPDTLTDNPLADINLFSGRPLSTHRAKSTDRSAPTRLAAVLATAPGPEPEPRSAPAPGPMAEPVPAAPALRPFAPNSVVLPAIPPAPAATPAGAFTATAFGARPSQPKPPVLGAWFRSVFHITAPQPLPPAAEVPPVPTPAQTTASAAASVREPEPAPAALLTAIPPAPPSLAVPLPIDERALIQVPDSMPPLVAAAPMPAFEVAPAASVSQPVAALSVPSATSQQPGPPAQSLPAREAHSARAVTIPNAPPVVMRPPSTPPVAAAADPAAAREVHIPLAAPVLRRPTGPVAPVVAVAPVSAAASVAEAPILEPAPLLESTPLLEPVTELPRVPRPAPFAAAVPVAEPAPATAAQQAAPMPRTKAVPLTPTRPTFTPPAPPLVRPAAPSRIAPLRAPAALYASEDSSPSRITAPTFPVARPVDMRIEPPRTVPFPVRRPAPPVTRPSTFAGALLALRDADDRSSGLRSAIRPNGFPSEDPSDSSALIPAFTRGANRLTTASGRHLIAPLRRPDLSAYFHRDSGDLSDPVAPRGRYKDLRFSGERKKQA